MFFANWRVMRILIYLIIQVVSVAALVAAEVVLSLILVWLVKGHGVIACGKGIFDSPNWFLEVTVLTGIPSVLVVGAGALFFWSSKRVSLSLE